jgi:hypothetical protein
VKPPLLAILAFAVALNAQAAGTNILGRAYLVEPGIWEILSATNHGAASSGILEGELRRFFESIEVSFPEGSSIRRQGNLLIIWNTPENLERFHRIWNADGLPSNQVEIDCSFVAFPIRDLDTAARKSGRAAATAEDVRALWRGGAGRLVSTSKVLTRSGVNAQVKGVAEITYPQEYERLAVTDPIPTLQAAPPGALETREIGTIFNVTPTVGPDGRTIDLSMVPELAELAGWDDVGVGGTTADGKKVGSHMRQPRFHSRNLTTSVVLWDGGTVVLGGFPGADGKETIYAFVSARLVNPAGRDDPSRLQKTTQGDGSL